MFQNNEKCGGEWFLTSKCEVLKDLAKKHDGIKEILAKECPGVSEEDKKGKYVYVGEKGKPKNLKVSQETIEHVDEEENQKKD